MYLNKTYDIIMNTIKPENFVKVLEIVQEFYVQFTKLVDEVKELKKEVEFLKETKENNLDYKEFLEFKEFQKTRK